VALVAALLGFGLSRDPSQLRSPLVAKAAPVRQTVRVAAQPAGLRIEQPASL